MEKVGNPKYVKKYGYWTSIILALITLPFFFFYDLFMKRLNWMEHDYFTIPSNLYILWVIPCLILALAFPIMISCLYFNISGSKKIFAWIGLMFGIMYGAVLITNYWLQMTLIREKNFIGEAFRINPLVNKGIYILINSLEETCDLFVALSFFFSGLAHGGSKLEKWLKFLMVLMGVVILLGVTLGKFGFMWGFWLFYGICIFIYPIVTILLAVWFKKKS